MMKPSVTGFILASLTLVFWLAATTTLSRATTGVNSAIDIAFEASAPYYEPHLAVVPASMPVRWINSTASPHSVRHDGCLIDETCAFQSIAVPPDSSFVIAPLPPGRYSYHCELHPIMRGTLVVESPAPDRAVSPPESPR